MILKVLPLNTLIFNTYGDYGILIINTLPNGSIKILPNYKGFTHIDGAYILMIAVYIASKSIW